MKKIFSILALIAGVSYAQPAPYPITINSQGASAPALESYQANARTFRVTFRDGTNPVNLTSYVPAMSWATTNSATEQYTSSWAFVSASNGVVDFSFTPAAMNSNGVFIYEVGVSGLPFVYRQGVFKILRSPMGSGAAAAIATNPNGYVSSIAGPQQAVQGPITFTGSGVSQTGNTFTFNGGGGGGSGTFTNLQWGTNNNTAQALIRAESNIVLRSSGGTNYAALANALDGDFTFSGAINANDNIEIANAKHLRFQDGGGTNTVHLAATAGRLILSGALDIVTGQAVPATINGLQLALNSDVSLRLASNVWAAADSTTNYTARTGDTMTGNLIITNASITVKSDSINAQFSDARGAAGVLLQTGSPSAATNTYGVVKLQDSGPSAGYGTLYFDSRVSPTGLWIKAAGTNRWNVWDQRNDGAGSGLDADLLDGLDSTSFAQLASSPTFTGTITAGGFTGNGAGLTNVTANALNGNAAQSLLTNNLAIQGTAPVSVTTTVGGNITTATVSLATSGTLPIMDGINLTNLSQLAILAQSNITDQVGGTNLVVVSNSAARLYFQRASNVAFFGFTGYATNAAFAISVECAPSATSFAFDPAISNRIAVVFNATNATLFQARKNRSESWVSVKQQ